MDKSQGTRSESDAMGLSGSEPDSDHLQGMGTLTRPSLRMTGSASERPHPGQLTEDELMDAYGVRHRIDRDAPIVIRRDQWRITGVEIDGIDLTGICSAVRIDYAVGGSQVVVLTLQARAVILDRDTDGIDGTDEVGTDPIWKGDRS